MEEWRDIKGYEGLYQVSSEGRVKSKQRIARNNQTIKEKIRKPKIDKDGYCCVSLWIDGISKEHFIHRYGLLMFLSHFFNGFLCWPIYTYSVCPFNFMSIL